MSSDDQRSCGAKRRHRAGGRSRALLWAFGAITYASGCAPLDQLDPGICGNGVVEPAANEDCEPHDVAGSTGVGGGNASNPDGHRNCGAVGSREACRWTCLAAPTGAGGQASSEQAVCPSGYGCGLDGICRKWKGTVTKGVSLDWREVVALSFGDFDADLRADLLIDATTGMAAYYGAADGSFEASAPLPASLGVVPGQLTGSVDATGDPADVAMAGQGLMVGRGQGDRSILPTIYAPMPMVHPERPTRIISLDAIPDTSSNGTGEWAGDEPALLVGNELADLAQSGLTLQFANAGGANAEVLGPIRSGAIVEKIPTGNPNAPLESSPCEEVAIAFKTKSEIHIVTPCRVTDNGDVDWNQDSNHTPVHLFPPVVLPSGHIVADGFLLRDLNGDGHLDLLIGATEEGQDPGGKGVGAAHELYVTYGVGNGTFDSHFGAALSFDTSGDGGVTMVDNAAVGTLPLDAGDLNGDGQIDLVMPDGVLLSHGPVQVVPLPISNISYSLTPSSVAGVTAIWQEARMADFNASGFLDVVATTTSDLRLTVLSGNGQGLFTAYALPLSGPADLLTVGDFDGDLIDDVAFREAGPHGTAAAGGVPGDSLAAAYGNPYGPLSQPQSMGRLGHIEQIAASSLATSVLDGPRDVLVLSRSEDESALSVAKLWGSTDRLFLAPFYLWDPDDPTVADEPSALALGQFDGDGSRHLDIAVVAQPPPGPDELGGGGPPPSWVPRLWLLPVTADAAIDVSTVSSSDGLPPSIDTFQPLIAAVDLDGDGIDELAMLSLPPANANPDSSDNLGALLIARRAEVNGKGTWTFDDGAVASMPVAFQQNRGGYYGGEGQVSGQKGGQGTSGDQGYGSDHEYRGRIDVRDLDGDGLSEVVALGVALDGTDLKTQLVIFPNHGNGTLDPAERVTVQLPISAQPTDFAWVSPTSSAVPELLVLTLTGAVAGRVDMETGALTNPIELPLIGGDRVAAGDINGDGVLDLAVADLDHVGIFLGAPEIE